MNSNIDVKISINGHGLDNGNSAKADNLFKQAVPTGSSSSISVHEPEQCGKVKLNFNSYLLKTRLL